MYPSFYVTGLNFDAQRKPLILTQRWRKAQPQTPLLKPKDRLPSPCTQYRINGGQSGNGAVFSEHFGFPLSVINTSKLHLLLSPTTGTIRCYHQRLVTYAVITNDWYHTLLSPTTGTIRCYHRLVPYAHLRPKYKMDSVLPSTLY
jgi:hypothetical protein